VSAAPGGAAAPGLRLVVANVEVGNRDYAAVVRLAVRTHPDLFGVIELTPLMARHLGDGLRGIGLGSSRAETMRTGSVSTAGCRCFPRGSCVFRWAGRRRSSRVCALATGTEAEELALDAERRVRNSAGPSLSAQKQSVSSGVAASGPSGPIV
jgi:hypothetical protein